MHCDLYQDSAAEPQSLDKLSNLCVQIASYHKPNERYSTKRPVKLDIMCCLQSMGLKFKIS